MTADWPLVSPHIFYPMPYAPGLVAVRLSDEPGLEARTNVRTGVCQVGRALWDRLSPQQRYFMLLHENAHLVLQTRDELACDAHALHQYRNRFPRDLMPTYTLLTQVLDQLDPAHAARLARLLSLINA